jgi:hypothetical protein
VLMIGRASDRFKRFELGIQAMKYISSEVKDCEMQINVRLTFLIWNCCRPLMLPMTRQRKQSG